VKVTTRGTPPPGDHRRQGSFRLTVQGEGKCRVGVSYEGQTPSVEVVVFEKPARYRLVLELAEGKYVLKRV
jgi:hypothetical protein